MTMAEFRTALDELPFKPFSLRMPDGRSIPVLHRDFVASAPAGRTAVVYQPNGRFNIVDVMLVSDLEYLPAKKPA